MHLGDFMYEYNRGMLAPQVYGRQGFRHMPSSTRETGHFDSPAMSGELLDFDDCITRYCSYRADPGLQAVSSAAPLPPLPTDSKELRRPTIWPLYRATRICDMRPPTDAVPPLLH